MAFLMRQDVVAAVCYAIFINEQTLRVKRDVSLFSELRNKKGRASKNKSGGLLPGSLDNFLKLLSYREPSPITGLILLVYIPPVPRIVMLI